VSGRESGLGGGSSRPANSRLLLDLKSSRKSKLYSLRLFLDEIAIPPVAPAPTIIQLLESLASPGPSETDTYHRRPTHQSPL
jgi:hypothetical protein